MISGAINRCSNLYLHFQRLGKEITWIALGQLATVVGALVGVRLLTEFLDPEAYGELALGMTVATFVHLLVLGPLSNGATRFYALAQENGTLQCYFSAIRQMLFIVIGLILLVSFMVGAGLVALGQTYWIGLGSVALIFAILAGCNSILSGIQNAARQRAVVALHKGVGTWCRFFTAVGLMMWLGANSTTAMLGYALAMLFILASQWVFFKRIINVAHNTEPTDLVTVSNWKTDIFTYSWPFSTWGILGWLNLTADRWSLQIFSSTHDVGLYAVLFQFGFYPISMLSSMFTQLVSPIFFKRAGDSLDPGRMVKIYALGLRGLIVSLVVTVFVAVISTQLHEILFSFFVAPEYGSVSYLLPWMTLVGGLMASTQFCSIVLQADRLTRLLIFPRNICNGLGVLFVVGGAAWFGLRGVIGGRILFELIQLLWVLLLVIRRYAELKLECLTSE